MNNKNKYNIKNLVSLNEFISKGFKYDKRMSDDESTCYYYRFPVYRYNSSNVIEAEFLLDIDYMTIVINVYESSSRGLYAPYYYYEYGNYDGIMEIINNNINKEIKKLRLDLEVCQ